MIVAIATNKKEKTGKVDPHFGRCNWYCLYDTNSQDTSFIENLSKNNLNEAGTQSAEMLCDKKISLVIAGRFGSKVADIFKKNNIQMIIPEKEMTLEEIIQRITL